MKLNNNSNTINIIIHCNGAYSPEKMDRQVDVDAIYNYLIF